jgi:Protein of unknown function (DUF1254)
MSVRVTVENRDTLYGGAVFDLAAGPVTITLPDPGRCSSRSLENSLELLLQSLKISWSEGARTGIGDDFARYAFAWQYTWFDE